MDFEGNERKEIGRKRITPNGWKSKEFGLTKKDQEKAMQQKEVPKSRGVFAQEKEVEAEAERKAKAEAMAAEAAKAKET